MGKRRNAILILEDILIILNKNKELSFNQIQNKTKTQWRTLKKCLEFLIKIKLIKERNINGRHNSTRLFSLINTIGETNTSKNKNRLTE